MLDADPRGSTGPQTPARDSAAEAIERPIGLRQGPPGFGSDVLASVLRDLAIPFVALNPGASYRGLHDSLVNFLGNAQPRMLLCLHEEHAVAIAHGWAKVTGRPMAAIVHSNVGLMHATMAIYNAWCDRVPMLVLGATGPVDAAKRRPWIDWIHTSRDQGGLVRAYVKWDDQPASLAAAVESMLRAHLLATTAPQGPTYVCLDAEIQEAALSDVPRAPLTARFRAPAPAVPAPDMVAAATRLLRDAKRPLILAGRVSRGEDDWAARIRLAEALGAVVLTDLKIPVGFPTTHPLHGAPSGFFPHPEACALLRQADAVLSLDWLDLAGTLKAAWGKEEPGSSIIQASVDQQAHNGWSMDHQGLPPVDINLLVEPDIAVAALLAHLDTLAPRAAAAWAGRQPPPPSIAPSAAAGGTISVPLLAATLRAALGGADACLIRTPLSWAGHLWPLEHPLDLLGYDGGGGIGSGLGMAIGGALALRDTDRLPIAVIGDGDFMMGASALWTAVHYRIPVLVVVANNRSFFNDEVHQDRVARHRDRPTENRWIGQRMADPEIDLAALARAQGALGFTVHDPAALEPVFREAVAALRSGQVVVVDVRVDPGYDPAMAGAMTRTEK